MNKHIRNWLIKSGVAAAILEAIFALLLYVADPFGVSSQKALSIDHAISWLTQDQYQSKAGQAIAVLLINDSTLAHWQEDWPVP